MSQIDTLQWLSGSQKTGFGCHYSPDPGSCGSVDVEAIDFSVCTYKNDGYIKPNAMVGKRGYKWKTVHDFGKSRVGQGLLYQVSCITNVVSQYVKSPSSHLLHIFQVEIFSRGTFISNTCSLCYLCSFIETRNVFRLHTHNFNYDQTACMPSKICASFVFKIFNNFILLLT